MEMEQVKEFCVASELKRQQDIISCSINISEKILEVLRGNVPKNDTDCVKEECILDTLKINSGSLEVLEKNLNEIARKMIG